MFSLQAGGFETKQEEDGTRRLVLHQVLSVHASTHAPFRGSHHLPVASLAAAFPVVFPVAPTAIFHHDGKLSTLVIDSFACTVAGDIDLTYRLLTEEVGSAGGHSSLFFGSAPAPQYLQSLDSCQVAKLAQSDPTIRWWHKQVRGQ